MADRCREFHLPLLVFRPARHFWPPHCCTGEYGHAGRHRCGRCGRRFRTPSVQGTRRWLWGGVAFNLAGMVFVVWTAARQGWPWPDDAVVPLVACALALMAGNVRRHYRETGDPNGRTEPSIAAGRCRYCGRELVDVTERSVLHDPVTGERRLEVWRQCPRFPRNTFVAFFQPGLHVSYLRDNPIIARAWR